MSPIIVNPDTAYSVSREHARFPASKKAKSFKTVPTLLSRVKHDRHTSYESSVIVLSHHLSSLNPFNLSICSNAKPQPIAPTRNNTTTRSIISRHRSTTNLHTLSSRSSQSIPLIHQTHNDTSGSCIASTRITAHRSIPGYVP